MVYNPACGNPYLPPAPLETHAALLTLLSAVPVVSNHTIRLREAAARGTGEGCSGAYLKVLSARFRARMLGPRHGHRGLYGPMYGPVLDLYLGPPYKLGPAATILRYASGPPTHCWPRLGSLVGSLATWIVSPSSRSNWASPSTVIRDSVPVSCATRSPLWTKLGST